MDTNDTTTTRTTTRAQRRHDARVRKDRANAILAHNKFLTRTPGGFINAGDNFSQTIAGIDPWSLPGDGGVCILTPATKRWERKQIHRAVRREGKAQVAAALND